MVHADEFLDWADQAFSRYWHRLHTDKEFGMAVNGLFFPGEVDSDRGTNHYERAKVKREQRLGLTIPGERIQTSCGVQGKTGLEPMAVCQPPRFMHPRSWRRPWFHLDHFWDNPVDCVDFMRIPFRIRVTLMRQPEE